MRTISLSLVLILICTASCAIGPTEAYVQSSYTKLATVSSISPKPKDAKILIYNSEDDVERDFQKLCSVEGTGVRKANNFTAPLKWGIKPEARKCGADAVIIQKRLRGGSGRASVVGVAIRFTDSGE